VTCVDAMRMCAKLASTQGGVSDTARYNAARCSCFQSCAVFALAELARFLPREARRCTFVSAALYAICWG
jgi:hypothetical protein